MNPVEDLVRAATRAHAQTLREVRPLRLPQSGAAVTPGTRARQARGARGARPRRAWFAPVTAAAAVIALAIALVIVRDIPNGRGVPATRPFPVTAGVPRYYVTLDAHKNLVVGDTFSGARLATIPPPAGVPFAGVTAAADDRTFVADTAPGGPMRTYAPRVWYLLRITPGAAHPAELTRLPIAVPAGTGIAAMALSGSGRELAVGTVRDTRPAQTWQLRIYSVATGHALQAWASNGRQVLYAFGPPGDGELNKGGLTWLTGDRDVAFSVVMPSQGNVVLVVPVISEDGGNVIRSSVVIGPRTVPAFPAPCRDAALLITADGKTAICPYISAFSDSGGTPRLRFTLVFAAYPASAPAAGRILYKVSGDGPAAASVQYNALWADASGEVVIVDWEVSDAGTPAWHIGVISHGEFRALPTPPGTDKPVPVSSGNPPADSWTEPDVTW